MYRFSLEEPVPEDYNRITFAQAPLTVLGRTAKHRSGFDSPIWAVGVPFLKILL